MSTVSQYNYRDQTIQLSKVVILPAYYSQLAIFLPSAVVVNLSAPPVVYEQNLTFSAMISLIAPSGGSTIEIDIMELGITATPFGET